MENYGSLLSPFNSFLYLHTNVIVTSRRLEHRLGDLPAGGQPPDLPVAVRDPGPPQRIGPGAPETDGTGGSRSRWRGRGGGAGGGTGTGSDTDWSSHRRWRRTPVWPVFLCVHMWSVTCFCVRVCACLIHTFKHFYQVFDQARPELWGAEVTCMYYEIWLG